jgi:EmrB/QacA subfamily drug resistance transporter
MSETATATSTRPPAAVFGGILVALSVAAISQTFVSTALPSMVGDLGGYDGLSWIVSSYMLASTIVVPFAGKLSDLYGTHRLFQVALVVFAAGSVLCARSGGIELLIAGRVLQGFGSGAILTLSFTLVAQLVSPRERGAYQGYIASLFTVANVAGPVVGGFFVDHLSWRWLFYVTAGIAAVALVVVRASLPRDLKRSSAPLDLLGSALLVVSLIAVMAATTWGGQRIGWTSPAMAAIAATFVVATALFVRAERAAPEPVMPIDMFRDRTVMVATILGFLTGIAMNAVISYGPSFVQLGLGVSATKSGLLLMPLMVCVTVATTVGGRVLSRTGQYRTTAITGALTLAAGTGLLATMTSTTALYVPSIAVGLAGIGIGLTTPAHMVAVQNTVDEHRLGAATSLTQFTRKIGATVGVALAGGLFTATTASKLRDAGALGPDESLSELLDSPERINALPVGTEQVVRDSVGSGAGALFLLTFVAAAAAFALSFRLPRVRLADAPSEPVSSNAKAST